MKWNWQQKDWPIFRYEEAEIAPLEKQFLLASGTLRGAFTHIPEHDKKQLTIELMSTEAIKTSEIEGEILSRDSVQSSIRRHFGLQTDNRKIPVAEQGIAEMMLHLYENFDAPLTHAMLYAWHAMLCNGSRDIQEIGSYRSHEDPMQVISGGMHEPKVHFEAPPSSQMQQEMKAFLAWFKQSSHLPSLARAAITHLYFVSIHPFEDGNGRIARALSEKALAEALGYPTLLMLSNQIQQNKKRYYDMLEKSNKKMEVTAWIKYFAELLLEAQSETQKRVEFLIQKARFFERFKDQLNERQEKALLRMFEAGHAGFAGGLSAHNYRAITGATTATATRDLHNLVEKKALSKIGELKHTRYWLLL